MTGLFSPFFGVASIFVGKLWEVIQTAFLMALGFVMACHHVHMMLLSRGIGLDGTFLEGFRIVIGRVEGSGLSIAWVLTSDGYWFKVVRLGLWEAAMRAFIDRWCQSRPVLVCMLMVSYSVQSLLITSSKSQVKYSATVAVFFTECLKLLFALVMLPPQMMSSLPKSASWLFAVPAALYTLQNRLVFEALHFISPPEYQLLNNMKLFSSLAFRVMFYALLKGLLVGLLVSSFSGIAARYLHRLPGGDEATAPHLPMDRSSAAWLGHGFGYHAPAARLLQPPGGP